MTGLGDNMFLSGEGCCQAVWIEVVTWGGGLLTGLPWRDILIFTQATSIQALQ